MGPPISLHMISTHHARINAHSLSHTHTHTHTQGGTATLQLGWHSRHNGARLISRAPLLPRLRTNYGFVFDFRHLRFAFCLWRSSRQWVHQHFFAWLWCTMCHKLIGFFVFRCAGRMGHVSSKRSLRDFDTQCIATVFELHVLLYGSNGSCVHLTFVFAWFWYTLYNNSLRIACFVV